MTAYTLLAGNNHVYNLLPADTISGLLANLNSTDTINGSGQTLTFTNLNTFFNLATSQFANVTGLAGIKISNGATTALIHVNDQMAANALGASLTVDASGDTGLTDFDIGGYLGAPAGSTLTGAHKVIIKSSAHSNVLQTDVASLSNITYTGTGASNVLQLTGGGNANLAVGTVTGINAVSLLSANVAYTLTLADVATLVTLNNDADTVVYGSVSAASKYILGAAGQTVIAGTGNDTITTTAADFSPFAETTIQGGGGVNVLQLTGGGTYDLGDASIANIQRIAITGASNVTFDNYAFNYFTNFGSLAVTLDNSNDQIDLRDYYYDYNPILNLSGGNGNNIIWLGSGEYFFSGSGDAYAQTVTLGTGTNTVLQDYYYQNKVNGGTGTTTTNTVGNNSVSTLVYTSYYDGYFYSEAIYEANTVVGFHAVDLGFNDSNLSFFGYTTPTNGVVNEFFTSDADFIANNAAGVVVYGTIYGGDRVTLNAQDQSYIAGGDAAAQLALGNSSSGNTVYLDAGGLTAAANGTELIGNAGLGAPDSALVIENSGAYNFNAAGIQVSGFATVEVDPGASVNLSLNSNGGAGYTVYVDGGTVTDNLVGGAATNSFVFDGDATVTGTLNGGGAASTVEISNDSTVDLTQTAISSISKITIDSGSTLILTSDQIAADTFNVDPVVGVGTLDINVSPGTSTLFISDLTNLSGFDPPGTGDIVINDNNNGDTIYAGPGTETINLGTGNDWVNAGSGNDTINASAASGQSAVIIVGDASSVDTVNLGTADLSVTTFDTVLGYAFSIGNGTGSSTVNIVGGITTTPATPPTIVDFSQEGSGLTASLYNINELEIGGAAPGVPQPNDPYSGNAEAIFTIEQLTALGGQEIGGFFIAPDTAGDHSSILKIIADKGPGQTNLVNNGNIYGFSGTVDILVTGNGTGPLPYLPVTTNVSGITSSNNVIVDQGATTGYDNVEASGYTGTLTVYAGTGVEAFDAGTGSNTIVFNHANAAYPGSSFTGNGGTYTFDINQNTDLTGSTFHGVSTSVTAVIAAGMTGKVNASDVDTNPTSFGPPATGFFVTGGTPETVGPPAIPGAYGTLDIVDNVASFVQNNIGVILSPPTDAASPLLSYINEVIDGTSQAGPLNINLTTGNNNPNSITVNDSANGDTVQAGTGTEYLNGGAGNDTFNFDEAGTPFTFIGTVNGGGGNDTLNVGDANSADVDFTAVNPDTTLPPGNKTITGIDNFNIGNGPLTTSEAKFWEYQLDSAVVTVDGFSQITVNVDGTNPTPHVLSLSQTPIGPIAVSSSFDLNFGVFAGVDQSPNFAAIVVNADNAGDRINLGYTSAVTPVVEVAYDGSGNDTIASGGNSNETDYVILGAGGVDTLYATTNSTVIWQFESRGGATDSWDTSGPEVLHAAPTAAFLVASDLFDNSTYVAGGVDTATIEISTNTDLSGATFVGLPNYINVDSGESVVFTDTQLATFGTAGTPLTAGSTTSGLVVDVTGADFAPTFTPDNYDLKNWGGTLTLEGTRAGGQTFDLSATSFQTEDFGGTGALYIYGGAGNDTAIFNGAAGTHGGVLDLGGGSNTLSVTGTTDFSGGGVTPLDIEHVGTISLGAVATPATNTATFTYQQIVNDEASNGGSITLTSAGGIHNYGVTVNGAGNIDLSKVLDTGYLANITGGGTAFVNINDANTTSVTVRGTNNTEASHLNGYIGSGDIINVTGLGDSVIAGQGSDLIDFAHYNVANNYQFRYSDLGIVPTSAQDLAAEGDVVIGLKANFGYADISGFASVKSTVATSLLATGANLGAAGGFGTYGVEFDSPATSINSFLNLHGTTAERIQQATIGQAATQIETTYTDSAINQGFIGVWDNKSDLALFYVNHSVAGAITLGELQLVGVFDTNNGAATSGSLTLPSTFFHIHTA